MGQRRTEEEQNWEGGIGTFSGKTVVAERPPVEVNEKGKQQSLAGISEKEEENTDVAEAAESSEEETIADTSTAVK